jgi:hypothetical protein
MMNTGMMVSGGLAILVAVSLMLSIWQKPPAIGG